MPKPRHRRHIGHPGQPTSQILAPNEVWSADFQGHFKTGDGLYCYPLTVADGYSRFLLGCQALSSTRVAEAKLVFTRLFKEFGLPKRIRTQRARQHGPAKALSSRTPPLGRAVDGMRNRHAAFARPTWLAPGGGRGGGSPPPNGSPQGPAGRQAWARHAPVRQWTPIRREAQAWQAVALEGSSIPRPWP